MARFQYLRDEVDSLAEADQKMAHWDTLGWELVSVCHVNDSGNYAAGEEKQPSPSWVLFFKQPATLT